MTPEITVTRGRSYGFVIRCSACGEVAHREAEIDADTKARWHRDEHLSRVVELPVRHLRVVA